MVEADIEKRSQCVCSGRRNFEKISYGSNALNKQCNSRGDRMLKKIGMLIVGSMLVMASASASASAKDLLSDEELAKKMSDYYKSASDQEIDEFIIGQTNAKKSVLPQKINKSITLYKVEYLKDQNIVAYGYEVSADNLGLTEKGLVAIKQTVTHNLREHHISYFCTYPSIRMELDIGIDFFINIISEKSHYLGSYQISKGDCIKGLTQRTNAPPQEAEQKLIDGLEKAARALNKNTPRMVDEITRMDASTVGPGFRVNINYTFPKHSAGEIDADQLAQNIRPTLKNYACSKKNMKLLLQYGADFVYLYHDKDGMLITSITIDRNDCGLREISLK
jgi:hypothetical protein